MDSNLVTIIFRNMSAVPKAKTLMSKASQQHLFMKELPKVSNHIRQEQLFESRSEMHKKRRQQISALQRDTSQYENPFVSKTVRSYRRRIRQSESIDDIYEMLENLPSKSTTNSDLSVLCDEVLKQCIKLRQHRDCVKILELMYEHEIPRTLATYNIIIDGYTSNNDIHSAMDIYHEYMAINDIHLTPNIITVNTLLAGCKHRGNIHMANLIWNEFILGQGIDPNVNTYTLMITVYARAGLPDHCYALFNDMVTQVWYVVLSPILIF